MTGATVRWSAWTGRCEVVVDVEGSGTCCLEPGDKPRGWRGDDEGAYLTAPTHKLVFRSSPTLTLEEHGRRVRHIALSFLSSGLSAYPSGWGSGNAWITCNFSANYVQ